MDTAELLVVAGRILLGGAFVFAGIRNITNAAFLEAMMARRGVPFAKQALYFGIALQTIAGLLLAAGLLVPYAAAALSLFLIVATPMFHNFWDHEGPERAAKINGVVGNVALLGGFMLAAV